MANPGRKKVIVIGAGLGGLSAAISLATAGYAVEVYEKNDKVGGKLNQLKKGGFTFDLGPSILTLPHYFRRLWERAGRNMEDDVRLQTVSPHWRNFFEDRTILDLYPDRGRMQKEIAKVGGTQLEKQIYRFLDYSARQYDLLERGYFERGLDTAREFVQFYDLPSILRLDYWHSMHGSVRRHISNRYVADIFDYFIKYVGSSAWRAPGFMNLMPAVQFRYDLWYVTGGMYNLARGLEKLLRTVGGSVFLNREIVRLETSGNRVTGARDQEGCLHAGDYVVSNMEVIPAYRRLLEADRRFLNRLRRFEPACSGLVLHLGTDRVYPQLAHHNFFYSGNQKKHFKLVFEEKKLPEDPTLYVVAPGRTDARVAPHGCDNIKILPHIPYIDEAHPAKPEDYRALRELVLAKLERMGLENLRQHIVVEDMWTPLDIRDRYYSNCGAIYGVVADRFKNFALKAPKQSSRYKNLFFVGGSVNPGGGMPMAVLCGQNVCQSIREADR